MPENCGDCLDWRSAAKLQGRAPSLFHPRVSKVIVCADLRGE